MPSLLVVTDRHGSDRPLADTVRAVLDAGARWIWFRDKDMEPAARRALAVELQSLVRAAHGVLTIGGDIALAAEIGAEGVHWGGRFFERLSNPEPHPEAGSRYDDRFSEERTGLRISPRPLGEGERAEYGGVGCHDRKDGAATSVRSAATSPKGGGEGCGSPIRSAGSRIRMSERAESTLLTGASAHSLGDVRAAAAAGLSYVTLSPVFLTASKPGYGPTLGLQGLQAAAGIGLPIVALGGVTHENARTCRDAGAAGVAVMGAIMSANDPAAETRRLIEALGRAT